MRDHGREVHDRLTSNLPRALRRKILLRRLLRRLDLLSGPSLATNGNAVPFGAESGRSIWRSALGVTLLYVQHGNGQVRQIRYSGDTVQAILTSTTRLQSRRRQSGRGDGAVGEAADGGSRRDGPTILERPFNHRIARDVAVYAQQLERGPAPHHRSQAGRRLAGRWRYNPIRMAWASKAIDVRGYRGR